MGTRVGARREPSGAVRLGVRRDQPLGTAHRLAPEAHFMAADREHYQRTMERALDALAAFTPGIEAEADPDARSFGQVLLGHRGPAPTVG